MSSSKRVSRFAPKAIDYSGEITVFRSEQAVLQGRDAAEGDFLCVAITKRGTIESAEHVAAYFGLAPGSVFLELPPPRSQLAMEPLTAGNSYVARGEALHSEVLVHTTGDKVAIFYHDAMLAHIPPTERVPECPIRLSRAMAALQSDTFIVNNFLWCTDEKSFIAPRCATWEEISLVHEESVYGEFVRNGRALQETVSPWPSDIYCSDTGSSGSQEAALFAAGISIDAAKAIANRDISHALCVVRPPGHHCSSKQPNGFCLLNNVVIALRTVQGIRFSRDHRVARCAVVDLDVHHGEGSQALLQDEGDNTVCYLSMHRHDEGKFFPYNSGGEKDFFVRDRGATDSTHVGCVNNVVNIPFNTSSGVPKTAHRVISDEAMDRCMNEVFIPCLEKFNPDIVFISMGFDAAFGDPLGAQGVVNGFARSIAKLKATFPDTGLCVVLEGGYNPQVVGRCCVECAHALVKKDYFPPCIVPPTWNSLREKQKSPSDVAEEDELLSLHQEWINMTLSRVKHAHRGRVQVGESIGCEGFGDVLNLESMRDFGDDEGKI